MLVVKLGVTIVAGKAVDPDRPVSRSEPVSMDRLERVFLARMGHLYAYLLARVRDGHLAEDICQQVFLKACQSRHTFQGNDEAMVGWLFRIAHNEAMTVFRRQRRRGEQSWEAMGETAPQPVDPEDLPEVRAEQSEQRATLAALLARLPEGQRDVVNLHYAGDLSLVQIAAVLGITDVAARQRLRRALAYLRGEINDPSAI